MCVDINWQQISKISNFQPLNRYNSVTSLKFGTESGYVTRSQPIKYKRSRSKGRSSRSQPNVKYQQ